MKANINSYVAILFITIAGATAALFIVHIAYANVFPIAGGSDAYYSALQ